MLIRTLGLVPCQPTAAAMQAFTAARISETPDELWLCEHPPTYTQGLAGDPGHLLDAGGIDVLQTNRGGQITYHGPGQVVAYPLVDLRRLGIYVKEYVFRIEQAVMCTLERFDVTSQRVAGAPGIYVRVADPDPPAMLAGARANAFDGLAKIAALGVKVSRHRTYHGVALNVAMDLSPFDRIHPCGYPGLRTTDLSTIGVQVEPDEARDVLATMLVRHLSA